MKKSKTISLVLISAALASCQTSYQSLSYDNNYNVNDSLQQPQMCIWDYAFRPYDFYSGHSYFPNYCNSKLNCNDNSSPRLTTISPNHYQYNGSRSGFGSRIMSATS